MNTRSTRMPALFIGHGSPAYAFEDNRYTRAWRQVGEQLPRPGAIVAISAHWYTQGTAVTAAENPRTIHDFYGFPEELFRFRYPAPGVPALAQRLRDLLQPAKVTLDYEWGFDHGSWAVLKHLYPQADIPVIQLSIDSTQGPQYHYELGRRLTPLRDEGVLILGAGNVVHNLRLMQRQRTAAPAPWATEFNDTVRGYILSGDHEALIRYTELGQSAAYSVPTPEHYLPLLYVMALQTSADTATIPIDGVELGSVSMLSVAIGASPEKDFHKIPQLLKTSLQQP